MHVHAARIDAGQRACEPIERERLAERDAELVLGLPSRDLMVGLGVDIRVDAERDAGRAAERSCRLAQDAKLWLGLDVEGKDAMLKGEDHLGLGLAHSREGDL